MSLIMIGYFSVTPYNMSILLFPHLNAKSHNNCIVQYPTTALSFVPLKRFSNFSVIYRQQIWLYCARTLRLTVVAYKPSLVYIVLTIFFSLLKPMLTHCLFLALISNSSSSTSPCPSPPFTGLMVTR